MDFSRQSVSSTLQNFEKKNTVDPNDFFLSLLFFAVKNKGLRRRAVTLEGRSIFLEVYEGLSSFFFDWEVGQVGVVITAITATIN